MRSSLLMETGKTEGVKKVKVEGGVKEHRGGSTRGRSRSKGLMLCREEGTKGKS